MSPEERHSMFRSVTPFVLSAAIVAGLPVSAAHAESNAVNLHAGLGVYDRDLVSGLGGQLGVDWQFRPGLAFDVALTHGSGGNEFDTEESDTALLMGVRLRFIDDFKGYLNTPRGNAWGNLWVVPRVGFTRNSDNTFGDATATSLALSIEVGYEFSVMKPAQAGVFLQATQSIGGDLGGMFFLAGMNVSIGTGKPAREYRDQDHDEVQDVADACADTPPDTEVDARGCTILRREVVLSGINFRLDSAEIEPSSERPLKVATQTLRDNPKVQVEIGGHTDSTGADEHNMELSRGRAQSVADWLVEHGIPVSQLVVKGYGSSAPRAQNDSEDHRALNRRIEFKRLD